MRDKYFQITEANYISEVRPNENFIDKDILKVCSNGCKDICTLMNVYISQYNYIGEAFLDINIFNGPFIGECIEGIVNFYIVIGVIIVPFSANKSTWSTKPPVLQYFTCFCSRKGDSTEFQVNISDIIKTMHSYKIDIYGFELISRYDRFRIDISSIKSINTPFVFIRNTVCQPIIYGITGERGPTGPTGPMGPMGETGATGVMEPVVYSLFTIRNDNLKSIQNNQTFREINLCEGNSSSIIVNNEKSEIIIKERGIYKLNILMKYSKSNQNVELSVLILENSNIERELELFGIKTVCSDGGSFITERILDLKDDTKLKIKNVSGETIEIMDSNCNSKSIEITILKLGNSVL